MHVHVVLHARSPAAWEPRVERSAVDPVPMAVIGGTGPPVTGVTAGAQPERVGPRGGIRCVREMFVSAFSHI